MGDVSAPLARALDYLRDRLGFRLCLVGRFEGDDELVVLAARDVQGRVVDGSVLRWPGVARRPAGLAVRPELIEMVGGPEPFTLRTSVVVPLRDADSPIGLLCAADPEPTAVAIENQLEVTELVADLVASVLALDRRLEQAEADALYDPLTGVANRRQWERQLAVEESRCRRHGVPSSVIVIDLDAIKEVNDREGHAAGDDLLRRTASVLRETCRGHDLIARLGGDEFGVLAVGCDPDDAGQLSERIGSALEGSGVSASLGFAGRSSGGGLPGAWDQADAAMYEAKRARQSADDIDLTEDSKRAG